MSKLIENIRHNSISHGSIPFWSWNDKLKEEELRRQIRRMKDLGMNGFFMHARFGLETEYLSEEWFDCVRVCVDEAERLDMEAWSYDENGWPSGFAGGKLLEDRNNHAKWLFYEISDTFPTEENVLGVYSLSDDGKLNRLTEPVGGKYHIIRKKYDESYVDTMDDSITRKFIAETHEQYKEKVGFSRHMPGFFTDEPQYYRWHTPWSDIMEREFEKAYGYSVLSALPALFIDFEGSREFRYDYFLLCHKLFINNFIKVVYDWCNENGCQLTGHAVEESNLSGQMWCCGGVMPFYEYEHIPGIDYLGRELQSDLAPKQIGSVCAQLGKKKVMSEMFACCGWDVTPRELKRIAELQYVGGVNLMCQHLYPYSERGQRKRDYPAHYSEHLPWQDSLKDFNLFYNNLGYTLSLGKEYANTLVIHPIHSAYLDYKREQDAQSIEELERMTRKLSDTLSSSQVLYHYGDETMMARMASVEGDSIRVGLMRYKYVIIPYSHTLDASTVSLLKEFISNGGNVCVYDKKPERIDGRIADMSWLKGNISLEDIPAPVKLHSDKSNVLRMQIRDTEYGRLVYIVNLSDERIPDVEVELESFVAAYEIDMSSLEKKSVRGENGRLLLTFESSQSYVLVLDDSAEMLPPKKDLEPEYISLPEKWYFRTLPENMITLDYVSVSFNGVNFEPSAPLVAVKDRLLWDKYAGPLYLRYEFEVSELPRSLSCAFEPLRYTSITVNGSDVAPSGGWWYDRSFQRAEILPFIHKGKNIITFCLDYFQRDYVYYVLYGGVSESLRNCLCFDTEIECVYLFGEFSVKMDKSKFTYGERHSVCYDGTFAIEPAKKEIDVRDIVIDGYPFFGGTVELETTLKYTEGDPSVLRLRGRYATAEIYVKGKHASSLLFSDTVNLKPYLKHGENILTVKLTNANRNLMGPHHRPDPEPYGVGPNTFSYEKEWKDGTCAQFLPRYAFVRFGTDL